MIINSVFFGAPVTCPKGRVVSQLHASEGFEMEFDHTTNMLFVAHPQSIGAKNTLRVYPVTNIKELIVQQFDIKVESQSDAEEIEEQSLSDKSPDQVIMPKRRGRPKSHPV